MMVKNELFEKSFSNLTRVFRIFGLQYFTLHSSPDNKPYNHHSSKISTKSKLTLIAVIAFAITNSSLSLFFHDGGSFLTVELIMNFGFTMLVILAYIHSYFMTSEMKKIFNLYEEICKLLKQSLIFDSDCISNAATIKNILTKAAATFFAANFMNCVFAYLFDSSNFYKILVLTFFSNIVINVIILRFILFIMLVGSSLQSMKSFLVKIQKISMMTNVFDFEILPVKHVGPSITNEQFKTLKKIYLLTWEMCELANKISGPSSLTMLILCILENADAGFKIYKVIAEDLPYGSLGCKSAVFMTRTRVFYFSFFNSPIVQHSYDFHKFIFSGSLFDSGLCCCKNKKIFIRKFVIKNF